MRLARRSSRYILGGMFHVKHFVDRPVLDVASSTRQEQCGRTSAWGGRGRLTPQDGLPMGRPSSATQTGRRPARHGTSVATGNRTALTFRPILDTTTRLGAASRMARGILPHASRGRGARGEDATRDSGESRDLAPCSALVCALPKDIRGSTRGRRASPEGHRRPPAGG